MAYLSNKGAWGQHSTQHSPPALNGPSLAVKPHSLKQYLTLRNCLAAGLITWLGAYVGPLARETQPEAPPLTPQRYEEILQQCESIGSTPLIPRPQDPSGGVTSSLILPGSANIMGGEAVPIKNTQRSGRFDETLVEDLLLERGVAAKDRQRYMKLACGENPKQVYSHTRLTDAWILRAHLEKARKLRQAQDEYCSAAASAGSKFAFVQRHGAFPADIALEPTIALLRGQSSMHIHCYLPEDMETMLRLTSEYGISIRGFHHATGAWQVPEMLKTKAQNITVATFAEFGLFKWESYSANLAAGKILDDNGIAVAYKSDHSLAETNAKYLVYQAGIAHAFHLPEDKALQAITSVPAKALNLDHRIGYLQPGYDAGIVVWDSHPLTVGATPLQVFIDGAPQLQDDQVKHSIGSTFQDTNTGASSPTAPRMRAVPQEGDKTDFCWRARASNANFLITGVSTTFLKDHPLVPAFWRDREGTNMTLVINDGKISCLGSEHDCQEAATEVLHYDSTLTLHLSQGHVLPGLTAVTASLGMSEILLAPSSSNGMENPAAGISIPGAIDYAKFGVQLQGRAFARARMGGVTRAVSPPLSLGGVVIGVSVGINTDTSKSLHNGGIFQSDVALHLGLDTSAQYVRGTISAAVRDIRRLIRDGEGNQKGSIFGDVAKGKLPLVVHTNNHWDMQQLISIKNDFPNVKLVILGGSEAPLVAAELSASKIPVILTENRPAPEEFRHRDAVVGPPLTPSVARLLIEAGVEIALSISPRQLPLDYRLHALPLEAGWAAKYAGLSDAEAVRLISSSVEDILGLGRAKDLVIWEGSPLEFGGAVVLSFAQQNGKTEATSRLEISSCWPDEEDV
ncbi:hypothetical protein SAPIO_CDS4805 [Scedosporium apiospermum]|uniref:Amidohydrolase-related domain-containing protein n=1 Tax=Pseudallescheria apiosperma TaxID=563466 RepID=A0A084G7N7_PSEDA|nr:uncharacterized protein SAPIO_CDS4805 [Scedosporium apiospermum]KEZ43349.1 hypothetical protein SAPIO_CDS4805 [Scedosporium apiospermum]